MHDNVRIDDYYWLRDDKRSDPAVLQHLELENNYTASVMKNTESLQQRLYDELRSRVKEDDATVPVRRGAYLYYKRVTAGQQYVSHVRIAAAGGLAAPSEADMPAAGAEEEVLLDENARRAEGNFSFYMIGSVEPSPDGRLLAWTEDTSGAEKYTLRVKDIATGAQLTKPIRMTSGDVVWANDNTHLFYLVKDTLDRPYRVYRHALGSSAPDALVFEENDEAYYLSISRSASGHLVMLGSSSTVTNETRVLPADDPTASPAVVLPRMQDTQVLLDLHPGTCSGVAAPGSSHDKLAQQEQGSLQLRRSLAGAAEGSSRGSSSSSSSNSKSIRARRTAAMSSMQHGWYVMAYRNGALPNGELRVAPMNDPARQIVVLPHRRDATIDAISLSCRWLIVTYRHRGLPELVAYRLPEGGVMPTSHLGQGKRLDFDEPSYSVEGELTGGFDSEVLRLYYSSMSTPPSVYDQHLGSDQRALRREHPVLGGFNRSDYTTRRLWARAYDGTRVPISLVYRTSLAKLDGSDPLMLQGYGAYGYAYDARFSREALSLLDRGWTIAIAHVRGGGELGYDWYEGGKFLKKRNTFTDFIDCAHHLIKENFTSPQRLAIEGRSAGGLLMGAVLNMAPGMFNAAILGVPFVDALTTMLDPDLPLTVTEWDEWGNPLRYKLFYNYMKTYSPVDNVRAQPYPHMLVTAGLHDPRVGYWEPAKFVAKLRAHKTNNKMLLMRTDMGAGHFRVTGRFARLWDLAYEYAFLLKAMGMMDVELVPGSAASSPSVAPAA